jgi:hypothetical protein
MRIDRVIYGSTVPTVQFGNQRPGFEASLEPGDDPVEAYKKLHEIAMKAVGEVVGTKSDWQPGSDFPNHMKTEITFGPPPVIDLNIERLEIAIDNAKSLDELAILKPQITGNVLQSHYMKRLKELTGGHIGPEKINP